MKSLATLTAFAMCAVFVCAAPLSAFPDPNFIGGTITATYQTGGPHPGWYFYEIDLRWELNSEGQGAGLSHWDMIFGSDCGMTAAVVDFDSPAGWSDSAADPCNPLAASWSAFFDLNGDTSLDPDVTTPVIKYNEPNDQPGYEGTGTFSFYADATPVNGTYTNALVGKAGNIPDTYGDLVGDAPGCTIPEPATVLLISLGGLFLRRKRRT